MTKNGMQKSNYNNNHDYEIISPGGIDTDNQIKSHNHYEITITLIIIIIIIILLLLLLIVMIKQS